MKGIMMILKKVVELIFKKTGFFYYLIFISGIGLKPLYKRNSGEKLLFFLMTPTYGNLGDQAIEYATDAFFNDYFPEYTIIKVHLEDTIHQLYSIKSIINKEDIVVLQGGGNFGNLYLECEIVRRYVLNYLQDNLIILMPSTITYTNDKHGVIEQKKSIKTINKNKQFIILAREHSSYQIALDMFPNCETVLVPDIVFYLHNKEYASNEERAYINICIRTDKESVLKSKREDIIKAISSKYDKVLLTDTQLFRRIGDKTKVEEIQSILYQFSHSRLVLTDRLHGLIFSYITNTPCIVFPSLDNKIKGSYEWIKQDRKIIFLENYIQESLFETIESLLNDESDNDIVDMKNYFDELAKLIGDKIDERQD